MGYAVVALVVAAVLLIGFSRAWFYNQMDMETLMSVSPPAQISILGPGGSQMTSLDLNYTDTDKKTENGITTITIRRVICVQSQANKHQLEIAHTTNLKNLTFKLYEAEDETKNPATDKAATVTDGGYTYKYDSIKPIAGNYINEDTSKSGDYKFANNTKHSDNFDNYKNVQSHAEPIYWKVKDTLTASTSDNITINDEENHRTYYVCEISWTEEKEKETDIFYVLAKTAQ